MDTIDNIIQSELPTPTHIKIDVDGIEPEIIEGGRNTLHEVKSILVELETELYTSSPPERIRQHEECVETIKSLGFELDEELYKVSADRHDATDWVGLRNFIFYNTKI